jgi:hypothetical protein
LAVVGPANTSAAVAAAASRTPATVRRQRSMRDGQAADRVVIERRRR